ncbi:MAG: 23S rRNA (guanosine(2251)-2'-O)-methyltransferase RlmB [Silvanigrellaceae bacterium]|nr:23S rRNA (guanosine(2251)-2'-O)-methyltransferase RlmB [Silvanigrellaceae bacterium]
MKKKTTTPSKQTATQSRSPQQKQATQRTKNYFVWGRRTVESFLVKLQEKTSFDAQHYELHVIVDKTNKAPQQLKPAVELAKTLGIKLKTHLSEQSNWPLADHEGVHHQRICFMIPDYPFHDIEDALDCAKKATQDGEKGCIGLVLDQIQDPRNFGAILRSAAFFGVKFVVYGTDRQSEVTPLVLKTSAGGAFSLMLIPVVNINRALANLKEAGVWIVGSSLNEKTQALSTLPKDRLFTLVVGNEEKGLRQDVMKNCDYLVKIPGGANTVDSLNVSVATGVFLSHFERDTNGNSHT